MFALRITDTPSTLFFAKTFEQFGHSCSTGPVDAATEICLSFMLSDGQSYDRREYERSFYPTQQTRSPTVFPLPARLMIFVNVLVEAIRSSFFALVFSLGDDELERTPFVPRQIGPPVAGTHATFAGKEHKRCETCEVDRRGPRVCVHRQNVPPARPPVVYLSRFSGCLSHLVFHHPSPERLHPAPHPSNPTREVIGGNVPWWCGQDQGRRSM